MWILPKNHRLYFLYAPDTEDSKKVLQECLEKSPSSLMWRSKPSQLRTWLTRWKRNEWFQCLSTRMLRPSREESFEDTLISSLGATPASRSQQPVNGSERRMKDIFGPTSEKSSTTFSPECVSLKMLKDIFPKDSTQYSVIWKKMVTVHRGEYSQRLKLAHRTRENGSLLWPTVTLGEEKYRLNGNSQARTGGLQDQANPNTNGKNQGQLNWLTPRANETNESPDKFVKRNADRGEHCHGTSTSQVNWSTPEARNNKGYHVQKDGSRIEKIGTQAGTGKLNPDWVEQLMGLPPGHTQLNGSGDNRVDRLRLLGNGVVPATAEKAFRTLLEKIS